MAAPRFRVLLQKDPEIFRDVPKIFYEFDSERDETNRILGPNITGVWAALDLYKTLDLALELQPATRRVVVVSGNGPGDQLIADRAHSQFRKYESRAEFSYLMGDSLEQVRNQLAALPRNSIVIFLPFSMDKAGNLYSLPEAFSQIAPTCSAPIYAWSDSLMGLGITGGNLLDFEAVGKRVGEMSLRVLGGERPEQIPQESAPTVMTVDWRELQRWGITPQALPLGGVIKFRQPSFWELYKWRVLSLVAAVIIEAMLIAWLLFMRARRRQAEREGQRLALVVANQHRDLNEVVSNVPGVVWEVRIDPVTGDRKTTFVSEYVEKLLGYSEEQFLSNWEFAFDLIYEGDRERVVREFEVALNNRGGSLQFRWVAKDGHIVWAEAHLAPILNEEGAITGIRGVTLDTNRAGGRRNTHAGKAKKGTVRSSRPFLTKCFCKLVMVYFLTIEGRCSFPRKCFLAKTYATSFRQN
jgi:PAS domain S-box-containing protein